METLNLHIDIAAPRKQVWETMLNDATYRQWTVPFHEGSHFKGSWEQGSEIYFLGPDEEGKMGGMYSRIHTNRLHEMISIEHLGLVADGKVDTESEEVKKWTPAFENYYFEDIEGGTRLRIEMQSDPTYLEMFTGMWDKALKSLKSLSEAATSGS